MEQKIKYLLDDLGIEDTNGEIIDDYYVITIPDYNEFNAVYNKLEKSLKITKNSYASFLNEEEAHIQYESDELIIELIAILDEDNYTLNITEG